MLLVRMQVGHVKALNPAQEAGYERRYVRGLNESTLQPLVSRAVSGKEMRIAKHWNQEVEAKRERRQRLAMAAAPVEC